MILALQVVDPTSPAVSPGAGTLFGQVLIFLTVVLSTFATLYQQGRNRKWDIEDRARIAAELQARLDREAGERKVVAQALAGQLDEKASHLTTKLQENTDISKQAFKEANSVNQKIARLSQMFDTVHSLQASNQDARLAKIDTVTADTNARVRDMGIDDKTK